MIMRIAAVVAFSLSLAGAAQASALCYVQVPGAINPFGIREGLSLQDDSEQRFFLSRLHYAGIPAVGVEEWGGCIRAFVRTPSGGQEMQLLHPQTFERIG
jgi:hypothetical protein